MIPATMVTLPEQEQGQPRTPVGQRDQQACRSQPRIFPYSATRAVPNRRAARRGENGTEHAAQAGQREQPAGQAGVETDHPDQETRPGPPGSRPA